MKNSCHNFCFQLQNSYLVTMILNSILKYPFVTKLIDGTLQKKIFTHHITKNNLYLTDYVKILSITAKRLYDIKHRRTFAKLAAKIPSQYAWYKKILTPKSKSNTPYASSLFAYMNFLLNTASCESAEIAVASILPRYWIYQEIAEHAIKQTKITKHPYQQWIKTHTNQEYKKDTKKLIKITDELASKATADIRKEMEHSFTQSLIHELKCWESSYYPK